ncbi:hypothetical protein [Spongiimicrobium sp. 2-473A-2-J]|uniref:hypothetical protein n=1 Tax=Eudoraea algarum TaxID=3417568 RepID=UPI003D35D187
MEDTIKLKMLLIMSNDGSIREFIRNGYTYSQIAMMTNELIQDEYVIEKDGSLTLSKKGEEWLSKEFKENRIKGAESWIVPEDKSRIKKLNENEVYLPNRNELHF